MKRFYLILTVMALLLLAACGEPKKPSVSDSIATIASSSPEELAKGASELLLSILGKEIKEAWLASITGDGEAPDMGSILRLVLKGKQTLSLEDLKSGILEILESGSYDTVTISPSEDTEEGRLKVLGEMAAEAWTELIETVEIPGLDQLLKTLNA